MYKLIYRKMLKMMATFNVTLATLHIKLTLLLSKLNLLWLCNCDA